MRNQNDENDLQGGECKESQIRWKNQLPKKKVGEVHCQLPKKKVGEVHRIINDRSGGHGNFLQQNYELTRQLMNILNSSPKETISYKTRHLHR